MPLRLSLTQSGHSTSLVTYIPSVGLKCARRARLFSSSAFDFNPRSTALAAKTLSWLKLHFEKARGFHGSDAEPFETRLIDGQWIVSEIKTGDDLETLKTLRKQGLSIRDIAERTGLSKSTVQRRLEEDDD